jgi:RNA polymerase sigma-70 factor (ECF subfamily)
MLAGLPEAQNSMIQMSFFEGLSHREIAEQTGLPLGTIKSRIRTAISAMRQVLQLSGVQ